MKCIIVFFAAFFAPICHSSDVLIECGDDSRNYCKVPISSLFSSPSYFHGKVVYFRGYIKIIDKGPWSGYWVSDSNNYFFSGSTIRLDVDPVFLSKSNLIDGNEYFLRGRFFDCRPSPLYSPNCTFKIRELNQSEGIIHIVDPAMLE